MQAWTDDEYLTLMRDARFSNAALHMNWPCHNDYHLLLTGKKP